MAMAAAGTFRYVVTVPREEERGAPWPVELAESFGIGKGIGLAGRVFPHECLVGHHPTLHIFDGQPQFFSGVVAPQIAISGPRLVSSGTKNASVAAATCYVDTRMITRMRAGDTLYLSRTSCARLGISLVRNKRLLMAAGAITAVSLGKNVRVHTPWELIKESQTLFRQRDPQFDFTEYPLQFDVDRESRIVCGDQWRTVSGYDLSVTHGYMPGLPGRDESAAISLPSEWNRSIAALTAELFETTVFVMVKFA